MGTPASLDHHVVSHSSPNGGWGSLPDDLLGLILDKLSNSIYDYIRCATVCKSWFRHFLQHYDQYRYNNKLKNNHQLPLLFIPTNRRTNRFLYNIMTKSSSRLNIRIEGRYCGSSHGWLIFAKRMALTLFNPFTAATIHLPPLLGNYEIKNVVLSDDPSMNNYEVLVLQFQGRLALFTSSRWIYDDNYFDNVGYFNDDHIFHFEKKFYALISGKLGVIEIIDNQEEDDTRGSYISLNGSVNEIYSASCCQSHFAESTRGTLLFVQKFDTYPRFRVYEVEEEESDEGLIKRFIPKELGEKGLEDQALFVGPYNESVCVRASDFAGCKANSIYFIADIFGSVRVGVYTLGDQDINPVYKLYPHLPPSVWIQPRPNLTPFVNLDEMI